MSVSYDAANMRGVIQLPSAVVRDKLRLGIFDAIASASLVPLDGDGNGTPGGILDFRFNVLVGDANNDGSVNGGDLPSFASAFNKSFGADGYNPRADWNADGSVNGGDLPFFAARFNQSLPSNEPGAINFLPFDIELDSESEASSDPEWELLAPIVDAFFSELDEEDEFLLLNA
jgi:hypothetical protein